MPPPPAEAGWPQAGGRRALERRLRRHARGARGGLVGCLAGGAVGGCLLLALLTGGRLAVRSWVQGSGTAGRAAPPGAPRVARRAADARLSAGLESVLPEALEFEPREAGSGEQLFLSTRADGKTLITSHSVVALVDGVIATDVLLDALQYSIVRHPALRAAVEPPQQDATEEQNPFLRTAGPGRWTWRPSPLGVAELAAAALEEVDVAGDLDEAWQASLEAASDASAFEFGSGPLWRLKIMRSSGGGAVSNALHFTFMHGLSDQRSANALLHELLSHLVARSRGEVPEAPTPLPFPRSNEDVLLQGEPDYGKLLEYALAQADHGGRPSVKLPSGLRSAERRPRKNWGLQPDQPTASERLLDIPKVEALGNHKMMMPEKIDPGTEYTAEQRRNILTPRAIPAPVVEKLRANCRANNVTISMAVAAAVLLAASDVAHDEHDAGYEQYHMLLGVDLRPFAPDGDWTNGTLAFAAGALDFLVRALPKSGEAFKAERTGESKTSPIGGVPFWDIALAAGNFTRKWIEKGWAAESTRLFDLGTRQLKMDNIIDISADNPDTIGRAYSVTVSNAGVYGYGEKDGRYGDLVLRGVYFGVSHRVSGAMLIASCMTVAGQLQIVANTVSPILDRAALGVFADSIVDTLTLASELPTPRRSGTPRQDYPVDVRAGMPFFYPLETPKGDLRCPAYDELRSPSMPPFQIDRYMGIWYELAFHDVTQANLCGCTQFNMTLKGSVIEDMFTVNCPWPWKTNLDGPWLPGWSAKTGKRRLNTYTCNMTMFYQPERLGVMREIGFGQEFDNMVLEVWKDPEMQSRTGYEYTRALQFQCVSVNDEVTFTGINFLSREPIVSQPMLQEMFVKARALGLEPYGSNDMHIVNHQDCTYPISTDRSWMGARPEWPCPVVFTGDAGAEL